MALNVSLSVVIPTYNSETHISRTIQSVYNELHDKGFSFEILIVNDGSTDQTLTVCREYKKNADYRHNLILINIVKNQGQRIATLVGLQFAKGQYVVILDDDLQYSPHFIIPFLKKISSSDKWIITGYYSLNSGGKLYMLFRYFMLFLLNYIFFPGYRKAKYYTSFKILNKHLLAKNGIANIYHFWEIPRNKIEALKIDKGDRIGDRKVSGTYVMIRLLHHVIIKIFIKIFAYFALPILFVLFLIGKINSIPLFTIIIFILVSYLYLEHNKRIHKKLNPEIY